VFPLKDNIPTDRFPVVTVLLILANVLSYFIFQKAGVFSGPNDANVIEYGAIPFEITHPGDQCLPTTAGTWTCDANLGQRFDLASTWLTVFTSMFMHGSILHLGGNMLFLWIFGNNVEDSMGPIKFVLFYLLGGLAALAGQVIIDPNATVPTVGASGAVSAVLGGYILMFPHARVITLIFIIFFFTIIELPALIVLGLWFLQQVVFGYFDLVSPTADGGGGVAYFAHIGGFVFGLALIRLFATRRRREPPPPTTPAWRV
jgi:membrane associated rhomboid family serine protease